MGGISLGTCSGLSARISQPQCVVNRSNPLFPCRGCTGLSNVSLADYQPPSLDHSSADYQKSTPVSRPRHKSVQRTIVPAPSLTKPAIPAFAIENKKPATICEAASKAHPIKTKKEAHALSPLIETKQKKRKTPLTSSLTGKSAKPIETTSTTPLEETTDTSTPRKTKPMKHPFTPEMDEVIFETYRTATGKSQVADLAKKFGIPRWAVSKRARNIGAYEIREKEPNWGEEDLNILKENAHKTPERIQIVLKRAGFQRSIAGIILKRKRLRLLQDLEGMAATTLAKQMGVDIKTITGWIGKEWLKAEKRGTNRTERQGGDQWYILKDDIRQFITDYASVIDIRKVDKIWLVEMLTQEGQPTKKLGAGEKQNIQEMNILKDTVNTISEGTAMVSEGSGHASELGSDMIHFVINRNAIWGVLGKNEIKEAIKGEDKKTSPPLSRDQVARFFEAIEDEINAVEKSDVKTGLLLLYRDRVVYYLYYAVGFSVTELLALNVTDFTMDANHPEYGDFGCYLAAGKNVPGEEALYHEIPLCGFGGAANKLSWYATEVLHRCAPYAENDKAALFFCGKPGRLSYPEFEVRFQYYIHKAGLSEIGFTPGSLRRSLDEIRSFSYFDYAPPSKALEVTPEFTEAAGMAHQGVSFHNPITLNFSSDRDLKLLSILVNRAEAERRSVENEIIILLEGVLEAGITQSTVEHISPEIAHVPTPSPPSTHLLPGRSSAGKMPSLIAHSQATESRLVQIIEILDLAIKQSKESASRNLHPLQRDKALFSVLLGYQLSVDNLLALDVNSFQTAHKEGYIGRSLASDVIGPDFASATSTHTFVQDVVNWYISEVRINFLVKAAEGENALFLSERGSRLKLPSFLVRLHKTSKLTGLNITRLFSLKLPTSPEKTTEEQIDLTPDHEQRESFVSPPAIHNRTLSYLSDCAGHFKSLDHRGKPWLIDVGHKLMSALNARNIPFIPADGQQPILTPNAGIFRIQGSTNVTVPIIEAKVQEIYTSEGIRIIAVAPEPGCLRLTVARPHREKLHTETALLDFFAQHPGAAADEKVFVGIREEDGKTLVLNPYEQPHTLVAGTTGSGKSVLIQNIILSIALSRSPEESKIFLIDPKYGVDYEPLERLPHILAGSGETISDPDAALGLFEHAVEEMERRYQLFRRAGNGVNNIQAYREITGKTLPTWWIIHDEFPDWMATKEYRQNIPRLVNRLSAKARAVGIFMVFAAQRPDHTVLPNQMRNQLGNRLILKVQTAGTSELALGQKGAEKLLGKGHMLAKLGDSCDAVSAQVPFIDPAHGIPPLVDEICAVYCKMAAASASRAGQKGTPADKSIAKPAKRKYQRRFPSQADPQYCVIE
jgi:site-specific recombinase XerD